MTLAGATWLVLAQLATTGISPGKPAQPPAVSSAAQRASVDTASVTPPSRQPGGQPAQFDATRFDTLTAVALRAMFEDAADRGLPVRLLVNRALEGSARKVPGPRILRVVREWSDALATAKFALGEGSTEAELDAAATAIRAGIEPRAIAAIRTNRPPGTAVTALVVLTDLVQHGVPAVNAREAIATIAREPRSDEMLWRLQQTVAKNAQRGPGMALDALNRYVRGTVPGAQPPSTPATTAGKPGRAPDP